MNYKITILLFVIAAALVTTALIKLNNQPLGQNNNPLDKISQAQTGVRLLDPADFNPDKVNRIELKYQNKTDTYIFARDLSISQSSEKGGWKQIKPLQYKMDNWAVNMLPSSASGIMVFQEIPRADFTENMTLGTLGLKPPQATVKFITDSSTVTVYLSGESIAGKTFLQLDQAGPVYVVDNVLHNAIMGKNPRNWRDKTIFENASTDISRINIADNTIGKTLALWKLNGKWKMIEPVNTPADQQAVNLLVSRIVSAGIQGFAEDHPDDLEIYGLTTPDMRISIELDKPEADGSLSVDHQVLLVGGRIGLTDEIRYAKRLNRDDIFTINLTTLNSIIPSAVSLISRSAVDVSADNIKSLIISNGNTTEDESSFILSRTIDSWVIMEINGSPGKEIPANDIAVNELLNSITTPHETVEIVDESEDPVNNPTLLATIEVEGFSGMIGHKIQIVVDSTLELAQQKIIFRDAASGINRFSSIYSLPPLTIPSLSATTPVPNDNELPVTIDTEPTK